MFKKLGRLSLAALFFVFSSIGHGASAQESGLLGDIRPPQQASEYIYRSSPRESLIAVQLLGAVNRPGVYYIPANTELLKLLTLAGGSNNSGDLSEVLVRKTEPKSWLGFKSNKAIDEYQGAYEVDVEKLLKYGGAQGLKLQQDDFIYVPAKASWLGGNVTKTVTFVSVLATVILTALLIDKNSK